MSARTRLIVAGIVALLVCLIFYFFFIRPRSSELGRVTDEVESAQNETTSLQAQLTDLRNLRDNAAELNQELNDIRALVPKTYDIYNFLLQVQDAATASGVGLGQIDPEFPATPPEGATLAQIRVTLVARGGYFSLQDFIRRLQELDRALSMDGITLSIAEDEGGEGEAQTEGDILLQMATRIFFEVPAVQAPPTVPGQAPVTTPPPAETPPADGATPAPTETTPAG